MITVIAILITDLLWAIELVRKTIEIGSGCYSYIYDPVESYSNNC